VRLPLLVASAGLHIVGETANPAARSPGNTGQPITSFAKNRPIDSAHHYLQLVPSSLSAYDLFDYHGEF